MKRSFHSFLIVFLVVAPSVAAPPDKEAIRYILQRQKDDGGYVSADGETKSTLRATSSAVRTLKYLGAETPEKERCKKFVASCFDGKSGGFTDRPGEGKPEVFLTAVGLMAVVELKMPLEDYVEPAVEFLVQHAREFEEIRIAAAGLEAVGKRPAQAAVWLKTVTAMANKDGTFGKGDATVRDTGGAVACQLRLGAKLEEPATVLAVLKKGQRDDGGFAKADAKSSDLETSYRVTRAFVMLKEKPDAAKLKEFIAKCRNDDGGYGVTPGAKSTVAGTYYAAILHYWLEKK